MDIYELQHQFQDAHEAKRRHKRELKLFLWLTLGGIVLKIITPLIHW